MNDLPIGWKRAALADVCRVSPRDPALPATAPFVPMAAVEVGQRYPKYFEERHVRGGVRARPGDVLFARITPCLENGKLTQIPATLPPVGGSTEFIVIRAGVEIDPGYLYYWCQEPRVRTKAQSMMAGATGRMRLSSRDLGTFQIAFPSRDEQQRIVEVLEDQTSRLDAALKTLNAVVTRLRPLVSALLQQIIPTGEVKGWRLTTVGEAGRIQLGRQRHPDWHTGPEMKPYLRVANVFEDRIDTRDVMEMDFSGVFERYRLTPGDVLLNEGQSPDFLGRPAIYRGEPPEVAFTNSLIRFKANSDVLPEWALLVFRRHMHAGRFMKESRITTNIAHLSASRLKSVEFPIPPLEEQRTLVDLTKDRLSAIERLRMELVGRQKQERALRQSLFEAAFSGRLTCCSVEHHIIGELSCV